MHHDVYVYDPKRQGLLQIRIVQILNLVFRILKLSRWDKILNLTEEDWLLILDLTWEVLWRIGLQKI